LKREGQRESVSWKLKFENGWKMGAMKKKVLDGFIGTEQSVLGWVPLKWINAVDLSATWIGSW
jgi:hypothetical protein